MNEVLSKLINERAEIKEKISKLNTFIIKWSHMFNNEYISLLKEQGEILDAYLDVLNQRIDMMKGIEHDQDGEH